MPVGACRGGDVYGHSLNVYGHLVLCTIGNFTNGKLLTLLTYVGKKYILFRYNESSVHRH